MSVDILASSSTLTSSSSEGSPSGARVIASWVTARASGAVEGKVDRFTRFEYLHVMVDDHSRAGLRRGATHAHCRLRHSVPHTRGRLVRSPGCANPSRDERQRLRLQGARSTAVRSRSSACGTDASSPTGPAPTAKPNDSYKRCSTNGPTPASTAARTSERKPYPYSSSDTTTTDHTAPSATNPRPHA